ncbi:MAG: cyclic nucleotide-binding domain-containing protein [Spirochaetaceae bacterium]
MAGEDQLLESKRVAVLCADSEINRLIDDACAEFDYYFEPEYLNEPAESIEYLNYEFPDLTVVNCTDPRLDSNRVLGAVRRDPWLHQGSIVLVYDPELVGIRTETLRELNLLAVMMRSRMGANFPRLLRILKANEHIFYQRDIHTLLDANVSGTFVLENDPFDLTTYSNLLSNFLFNARLVDHEQRERFHVALMELLMNAVEHGNCRITYEEKSAYMAEGGDPLDLIRTRNADPEISRKKVYLTYRIHPESSEFSVRDEGEGFDWRSYSTLIGEDGIEEAHGRGILMASHYLSDLTYNDKGNEARFHLQHQADEEFSVPEVFNDAEELSFEAGDIVFSQGDRSSHLYYIASGSFDILVGGDLITRLTPADVFLGEMSFLLNNRRSATVRAAQPGTLVRISKRRFVNAIKERPQYGLFLARLLSRRLFRLHHLTG